jgi:hypothetical protein
MKNSKSSSKIQEPILAKDITKREEVPIKILTKKEKRRYYLHSRLRRNGIYYNPHTKKIETSMDNDLDLALFKQSPEKVLAYIKELFSDYNYHIQKTIIKPIRK